MKYSNVLLATKINQIMLYFELMDAKTQELSFKKVAEGGSGGDDDDETEEEEEETEDEEEAKKSHPPPPPPPPKTMKVKCEDDEMPIGFEGAPPPPPPPIPSKMTEAKSIDDEMPIGFEGAPPPPLPPSSDVYRAPTLEGDKMVIDTDISGVNLDFLGSKPPPAKKAKTRVPAQINMTVSSPTAIAGQYNVVTIKLEGQMLPDTIAPVWGNHSLLWRHEPSGAKGRFALSTLRADGLGRTDVEVNMSLLDGLPNAKGTIEVRLDSEDSPKCVTVRVVPDVLDQKATTFKVLQGAEGVRAGEPVKVAVFPKDKYSNEGASVEGNDVLVIAQGKEEVKGVYCGDSERLEYTMTFRASGKYKLFVSCNRAMISGAPMDLVVAPGHLVKIEVKDLTRGHKVGCGSAAAVLPNFRVTGQDGCGNAVKCNPAEVGMVLYAKRDPSKAGRVENQKVELNSVTGNVIVRNATVAPYPRLYGEYVLRVFAGAAEELVPVEFLPPELDLVQCFIERPICVKLGELCRAVVTLRDTAGGPYTGPVRELRLECRTPQCSCEGVLNQNKDKATFTFFPTRAQHWDVSVKYAGKDITGSPFKLDVVKPCDLKPVVPDLPATTTGLAGVPVALMPPPAMTTPSTSPKKTGAATPGPSCDDDIQTLPF